MKRTQWRFGLALLLATLAFSPALGAPKWIPVGDFQAGGAGKLAAYNGTVSACRLVCTEGSVIVNTCIVIEGNKKTPISLGVRIPAGQMHEFALPDGPRAVTGFRISDNARGKYRLEVLKRGSNKSGGNGKATADNTKKKDKNFLDEIMEALPSGETETASRPAPQAVPTEAERAPLPPAYQPAPAYQPPPIETAPPPVKRPEAPAAPQVPAAGGDPLPWEVK
ncbi:MAG: hypothetical protein R6X19_10700 [Kiritimatiellia bacterium]